VSAVEGRLGIYVHLPFCPYLCPYCDFAKWPMRASAASKYLKALYAELDRELRTEAASIFLGGGTPNAYDASTIAQLVDRLRERFPSPDPAHEITIEINPELVRPGDFEQYRAAGITRLSIGVQSFERDEIATLGRKHTPEQVAGVVAAAREAGLGSISIDLMFGVPQQTPQSWLRSLERAVELGVDHISTYGLTVEEGTPYADWFAREPRAFFDDTREAELYALAIERLEAAGYEHYEISNFAKPGHHCAHNANYWVNGEYVGLGVGAASFRDGVRAVHTRDLEEYLAAALAGEAIPSESERLVGERRVGEAVMLALRTSQGVGLGAFKERYGVDLRVSQAPVIDRYRDLGLLELIDGHLRLTKRGRFVANDVCGAFLPFE
jgi:oxygen-independent coproporphyrinogen III oxidase